MLVGAFFEYCENSVATFTTNRRQVLVLTAREHCHGFQPPVASGSGLVTAAAAVLTDSVWGPGDESDTAHQPLLSTNIIHLSADTSLNQHYILLLTADSVLTFF